MGQGEGRLGGGDCDQAGEKLRHLLSEAIPIWKCCCKAPASRGFGWKGLRASHRQLWTSCGLCKPRMSQRQKKQVMFCLDFILYPWSFCPGSLCFYPLSTSVTALQLSYLTSSDGQNPPRIVCMACLRATMTSREKDDWEELKLEKGKMGGLSQSMGHYSG